MGFGHARGRQLAVTGQENALCSGKQLLLKKCEDGSTVCPEVEVTLDTRTPNQPNPISVNTFIMLTCPCNVDPPTPHFYVVKHWFPGVYIIFALKHRLWVLGRTALLRTCTHNVLSKNKKKITIFHLKIINFIALKYCSILHRRVFVM